MRESAAKGAAKESEQAMGRGMVLGTGRQVLAKQRVVQDFALENQNGSNRQRPRQPSPPFASCPQRASPLGFLSLRPHRHSVTSTTMVRYISSFAGACSAVHQLALQQNRPLTLFHRVCFKQGKSQSKLSPEDLQDLQKNTYC